MDNHPSATIGAPKENCHTLADAAAAWQTAWQEPQVGYQSKQNPRNREDLNLVGNTSTQTIFPPKKPHIQLPVDQRLLE
ncbi:MAG: hypothetical protein L6R36_007397 [Xanthoria steineri]|nr:MAG: hypothetical protein L6R36_007397 [Xanthoria steineri]